MTVVTAEAPQAAQQRELPPSMVERMTLILDAFPGRSARLTLEDVARTTQLPRSTAHRILDQLVKLSWLDHSSFGYRLGRRALHLGRVADDHSELRAAASSHLHALMMRTGLTIHLGVLDEGRIHYLDKIGARSATSVPSVVGGYAPAHCTALGRAMLTWLPAEEVDERVGDQLRMMTTRTVSSLPALHQELNRVRARRGLAIEHGEAYDHISCVAAAIHSPEGPIGAISLVGDAHAPLERVAPLVLDVTRQVSHDLFPDLDNRRSRRHSLRAG